MTVKDILESLAAEVGGNPIRLDETSLNSNPDHARDIDPGNCADLNAHQTEIMEGVMTDTSGIKEHMDVISVDHKIVGKVDHMEGNNTIKLTKSSSPDGAHHHFISMAWVDHIDEHVHLNKSAAEITAHWAG
jgi:hypothetical protein